MIDCPTQLRPQMAARVKVPEFMLVPVDVSTASLATTTASPFLSAMFEKQYPDWTYPQKLAKMMLSKGRADERKI
jgi:hypothetical protein